MLAAISLLYIYFLKLETITLSHVGAHADCYFEHFLIYCPLDQYTAIHKKGTRKMFPRDVDQEVVVHSSFPFRYSPTLNLLPKFKAAEGKNFL